MKRDAGHVAQEQATRIAPSVRLKRRLPLKAAYCAPSRFREQERERQKEPQGEGERHNHSAGHGRADLPPSCRPFFEGLRLLKKLSVRCRATLLEERCRAADDFLLQERKPLAERPERLLQMAISASGLPPRARQRW